MSRKFAVAIKTSLCCGLTLFLLSPLAAVGARSFVVLHAFTGDPDGSGPFDNLIRDENGNFYGTTTYGGNPGYGAVFKIGADGSESVLHSFVYGSDGAYPAAGLIIDSSGNLFGTTSAGGSGHYGTVFKLAPDGTETVLYSFTDGNDGAVPEADLIMDKKGNLYGTTSGGPDLYGSVFKLTQTGTLTTLYSFTGLADGAAPFGGVIVDKNGNFYGTTFAGGSQSSGVVFKLMPDGTETVLHSFTGGSDGAHPMAGVIMDLTGNLYGTTSGGGGSGCGGDGCGAVFQLKPDGSEAILHSFTDKRDGAYPTAGLIMDKKRNLYGTTTGYSGFGTVFKLVPDGTLAVFHTFTDGSDGGMPYASLIQYQGFLYGTTSRGGEARGGDVFKVKK